MDAAEGRSMQAALAGETSPDVRNRELLTEFVRINDAPCVACGYNLRNLTGDVCPECGNRFALRVGVPNLRFGPLVACLAPLLMVSGLLVFLIAMTIDFGVPSNAMWYWAFLVQGLVDAVGAVLLYRRRWAYLSMPVDVQWRVAGVVIGVNAVAFVTAIVMS
ncbi:MAG: hypothetical protein DPW13_16095 [Planctomycetes bacterium]|nr:hypothetical protein [Planctomycetota bacterium]